ncbi:NGG1p interacting factor NIF3 [Candidatus Venteria ishoeyi]|uniref:NGG1p interacting factor NIF3 n=1 Tax=Candidatus Venteria ishoeyi TaxID=1899563 RepID=UPI000CDF05F1|nr:NGG1p interacting factor NIF3 [Candidatus Venteria ishoeyi]MDM8547490.1 NGG1p interacting factor NIF3 [Candidatus Venteria ishoeyi]
MYKICFFVPETHLEQVKNALFEQGAGRFENYDACSWQTLGQGQFRPLAGSQPFLGRENIIETVNEYKVEMICQSTVIAAVLKTLIAVHPYEEPAYDVYEIKQAKNFPGIIS